MDACGIKHPFPFYERVAKDAGVRSLPQKIAADKRELYFSDEIRGAVYYMVRNAENVSCSSRFIYLTAAASAAFPCSQRHADGIISLFFKEISSYGAVNSAGHTNNYTHDAPLLFFFAFLKI
jgi:hypothetical protein